MYKVVLMQERRPLMYISESLIQKNLGMSYEKDSYDGDR